jgi:catechol 2,3-dioxygenase-like lactoylglutathione lyase family enzyme
VIQHVAVETREADVEACVAFYELLGFERAEAPASLRDRAAWVQRGTQQVHLMFADEPVVPPRGHMAVVEADYESVVERLRDAGFEVDERAQHWGSPRCFVNDPAGHRVEVMAFAPGG